MPPQRPPAPAPGPRIDALCRRCAAAGLEPTEARRAVIEAVVSMGTHPTADEVHAYAARRHPGLGRATVYRTLESLVRIGVFTKALHSGAAVRYDAVSERHHHLVCVRCESILDVHDAALDALPVPDTSRLGFEVSDFQVQIRGICRDCRNKEEPS